jgi:hypothetical protein
MTPPPREVCPRPGAPAGASSAPCPLWSARAKVQFQRSIEADAAARLGMTALVYADAASRGFQRPVVPPTRPVPIEHRPLAELVETTVPVEAVAKKGALKNA